jgi:DNA-binding NtrC family response regulator
MIERALLTSEADIIEVRDLPHSLSPPPRPDVVPSTLHLCGYAEAKQAFERDYLANVLAATNGNIAAAARLAKTDRSNFRRLLKRAGIEAHASGTEDPGSQGEPRGSPAAAARPGGKGLRAKPTVRRD